MADICLALGGGGSKGYAHLGVIKALQAEGFQIRAIAGTSAGGMAAAVFAAGFTSDQIIEQIGDLQQDNLYGFGRGPSLLGNKGIREILSGFLEDKEFSDLKIPCAMTAVDLVEMREIIIQEGNVLDAVMATTAIPGIFPPFEREDQLLVDGMVLNPIPVGVARSLAKGFPVIAVSLSPEAERWRITSRWDAGPENPLLRPISRLRVAKAFEVYLHSMDMALLKLVEIRLEIEKPDLVLRPEVFHIGSLDRVDIREVASLGEDAVRDALPKLKRIRRRRRFFRW